MTAAKINRSRRKRRQGRAGLKRVGAKPKHKLKAGRTGGKFAKKNHSAKHSSYHVIIYAEIPRSIEQLLQELKT